MIIKRVLDLFASFVGIIFLAIPMVVIACWIKADSTGPVFFRQVRVGRYGKEFKIYKFRTMVVDAEKKGMQITVGADSRVSDAGSFLRQYKLDELPQFLNVLVGDMSMVGPRPEVPKYVAMYPTDVRERVLSVRPGITDLASLLFRNENEILARSDDPERTYIQTIIPTKLNYYLRYIRERSLLLDLRIIVQTIWSICL